jgi:MHS family alpha-ketoglutarate permease-like MFS transporter
MTDGADKYSPTAKPANKDSTRSMGATVLAILGGSIGNLVEWFDWYAYSAFAVYFAKSFFPNADPTVQLLNSAGIFALGFFMRPIGGWLLGRYADAKGRKAGLTLTVSMMSIGSFMIAICPTYEVIGIGAPIILTLARLIQGISVGGEYGSSATYLSEMATAKWRGFYSSFQYVTLIGGQLVALALQIVLQQTLTDQQLYAWGWRIPFFVGACCAIVAWFIRSKLPETAAFESTRDKKPKNYLRALATYPKSVGLVMGLTLGGTVAFYTYSIYMQKFLVNTVGLTKSESTTISAITLLVFCFLQPVVGAISDLVGRRIVLIMFGVFGTLLTVPILTALSGTHSAVTAFWLIMSALVVVSGYTSINAVVKAELFPAEIRAIGIALPYAIANSLFGGTAEYIALFLKHENHESWFYWYVTGCILVSLIVYASMSDKRDLKYMRADPNPG